MRISIFLNDDLESNIAINCLLPELTKHQFNIFLSQKVGPAKHPTPALQQLEFLEQEFIQTKLFPKLEKEQYPSGFMTFNQIKQIHSAKIVYLDEIKSQRTISIIKDFKPDLFLSIRFGKIFKGEILSIPPLGIINLHSAILPDYKGVLGTLRAFMDGKKIIGSTIHYISDSSIDTGEIIFVNHQNVVSGKSILWHIVNLYPVAIKKLCNIVSELSNHRKVKSVPQINTGNYYSFPNKHELVTLKDRGFTLFNLMEYALLLSDLYKIDKHWAYKELHAGDLPETG